MDTATADRTRRITALAGLDGFIESMKARDRESGGLAHIENIPAREAAYGSLKRPLPDPLLRVLAERGVERLYSHQAEAVNRSREGESVIVSTSTASGKSMCYTLPVFEELMRDGRSRALFMYPTKALAHDQLSFLREFTPEELDIEINAYDGDTKRSERRAIRQNSEIIISNPDMVHAAMLPFHRGWSRFLGNLKYVVVDEAHIYRGVFGAHVALILRRLRRIARHYGADPRFVLCSATIANAKEHARALTGLDFSVVSKDGSPSGGHDFVFWNLGSEEESSSVNMTTAEMLTELVGRGVKTLAFARSRAGVERISNMAQDNIVGWNSGLIQPYRAGYLADYRRDTEERLASSSILGLVSTNAMELGVDVGALDCTLIGGYPGTISSVWQQAGRSGRSRSRAVTVLIARDHPVDNFFCEHPDAFFSASYETARVATDNPILLDQHLRCAAQEMPLSRRDFDIFDEDALKLVAGQMVKAGTLTTNPMYLTRSLTSKVSQKPAFDVNIRSMDSERWKLLDEVTGRQIEEGDSEMVFRELYPGAVRMHRGRSYLVRGIDRENLEIRMAPMDSLYYYTVLETEADISVLDVERRAQARGSRVGYGKVEVTRTTDHYIKKGRFDDHIIEIVNIEWPSKTFQTNALWWEIPGERKDGLVAPNTLRCLAAMSHPATAAISMFAMCDPSDIGAVPFVDDENAGPAGMFVFDNHAGGVGISEMAYDMALDVWRRMLQIILSCSCRHGCPRCIESPMSGSKDELDKQGAIRMLQLMISEKRS